MNQKPYCFRLEKHEEPRYALAKMSRHQKFAADDIRYFQMLSLLYESQSIGIKVNQNIKPYFQPK